MCIDTQHVSRPRARRLAAGIALAALVACLAPRGTPTTAATSSERMRRIGLYRLGVVVDYNAGPPAAGRGSCIFLHVWRGPRSSTAGCTAMAQGALAELVRWLDPARRPALVQLTDAAYARRRAAWGLP